MNKISFLEELTARLYNVSPKEVKKVIQYFSEIIDDHIEDGLTEEQAVRSLGDMDDIVASILSSTEVNDKKIH